MPLGWSLRATAAAHVRRRSMLLHSGGALTRLGPPRLVGLLRAGFRLSPWQRDHDCGAVIGEGGVSAVSLRDRLDDGEAEAGAAAGAVGGAGEAVEGGRSKVVGEAGALVVDREADL